MQFFNKYVTDRLIIRTLIATIALSGYLTYYICKVELNPDNAVVKNNTTIRLLVPENTGCKCETE